MSSRNYATLTNRTRAILAAAALGLSALTAWPAAARAQVAPTTAPTAAAGPPPPPPRGAPPAPPSPRGDARRPGDPAGHGRPAATAGRVAGRHRRGRQGPRR